MKTFGFAILLGGAWLLATPLSTAAMPTLPSSAPDAPPQAATIQHVLYGDAPMPGQKRGGGGKKREGKKKDLSPTLPSMNGANREDADKEYKKKYGF